MYYNLLIYDSILYDFVLIIWCTIKSLFISLNLVLYNLDIFYVYAACVAIPLLLACKTNKLKLKQRMKIIELWETNSDECKEFISSCAGTDDELCLYTSCDYLKRLHYFHVYFIFNILTWVKCLRHNAKRYDTIQRTEACRLSIVGSREELRTHTLTRDNGNNILAVSRPC